MFEELESERGMSKKPTRTVRVPAISASPLSYFDPNRLGLKDEIAEHVGVRRVQGIAAAKRGFRQSRPDAICRASS
jgi:hypothetical protein